MIGGQHEVVVNAEDHERFACYQIKKSTARKCRLAAAAEIYELSGGGGFWLNLHGLESRRAA